MSDVTYAEARRRGKEYGEAHGYEGRAGGWVWNTRGRVVNGRRYLPHRPECQGWAEFYYINARRIERDRAKAS